MKKLIPIILALVIVAGTTIAAFAATISSYTDVPDTHWASSSIKSCTTKKLMQGTGDNKFEPESGLTRAQVAQICYNAYKDRLSGTDAKTFGDVADTAWYADAVRWMNANGIINGTTKDDGKTYYYPNAVADRKYVALVLYRVANKLEVALPDKVDAIIFPDIDALGSEYQKAINELQQAGVISGFPDGEFKPDKSLTRAEAAKLFDNFTDLENLTVPEPVEPTPPVTEKPTEPTPPVTEKPTEPTPPVTEKPTEPTPPAPSGGFLSADIFPEIQDYATSLRYTVTGSRTEGLGENQSQQLSFKAGSGRCTRLIFRHDPGNGFWTADAYLDDSPFPVENALSWNIDDMKAMIDKYANYQ